MKIDENNVDYEISDSVLVKLAKMAVQEVPGVAGVSTSISARFSGQNARGLTVKYINNNLIADVHIVAYLGENLRMLAFQVQQNVGTALQTMVDPISLQVHVTVEDVVSRPKAVQKK